MTIRRIVPDSQKTELMEKLNIPHTGLLLAAVRNAELRRLFPLYVDPYAQMLVSKEATRLFETMDPAANDMLTVRVRFFDDQILAAVDRGFEQFVVLGTGMDTRPYRQLSSPGHNLPSSINWFEVDYQHVLEYKGEILKEVSSNPHLERVGSDIRDSKLFNNLQAQGFDRNKKTFFIMEGVMSYLKDEKVDAVICNISSIAVGGSQILIDIFGQSDMPSQTNPDRIYAPTPKILSLMPFSGTNRQPPIHLFDGHGLRNDIMTFNGHEDAHYGIFLFPPIRSLVLPPDLLISWFALYTVLDKGIKAALR
jgi:methyltransferase (TIGR00027 family)